MGAILNCNQTRVISSITYTQVAVSLCCIDSFYDVIHTHTHTHAHSLVTATSRAHAAWLAAVTHSYIRTPDNEVAYICFVLWLNSSLLYYCAQLCGAHNCIILGDQQFCIDLVRTAVTCIREALRSILGQTTACTCWWLSWLFSVSPRECWHSSWNQVMTTSF